LEDNEYVSLMTAHSAKGTEFKIVFIACLEQTLFPSSQSLFERLDVEEERRLFYVALTRAKEYAILTSARQRFIYGHYAENGDSQFLSEIDEECLERSGLTKPKAPLFERPSKKRTTPVSATHVIPEYERVELGLTIGDRIRHTAFGLGVVVNIEDNRATIAFTAPYGIKILMKDHPSISKER